MKHIILLLLCLISVEILSRNNFIIKLQSIIQLIKNVSRVISSSNISDHWKELIIPHYALSMMRYSVNIFLVLILLIILFLIPNFFLVGFMDHLISFKGIAESIVFIYLYIKLKMLLSQ